MASDGAMSDEDMRKELQNIQMKMNETTDQVNKTIRTICSFYHVKHILV